MKKCINGQIVDLTTDELTAIQQEASRIAEIEKLTPPTNEERLAALESAILNILGVI